MPVLSRPVTAQRARLYLRCFFTGTGTAALSSTSRLPAPDASNLFRTSEGAISAAPSATTPASAAAMRCHSPPASFSSS